MEPLRSRVALVLVMVALSSAPAAAADEVHWTIMGPTAVTFDWRGSETTIRYGTTTAYGQVASATLATPAPFSSPGPFHEARLTGLQANTLYHYSIGTGPDHTFRTPPPRGSSGFLVGAEGDIGDTGSYSGVAGVQALFAAARPAFMLMVGDLTYGNAHGQAAVDQHFNDMMVWSRDAAYMPAWGNHEWDKPAEDDLRNYKGRFDLPNAQASPGAPGVGCCGEDWYWFDYGNVRFIAYPEPWSGAWSDWRTKAGALMDEAQADPAIQFIVTFGHRPALSSGHHPGNATLLGHMNALGDSHSKYVLNINGHSHNYERTTPQHGVVHVTAGAGGSSLEQDGACLWLECTKPAWSAFRAMRLGAVLLHFSSTAIRGEFRCGPAGAGTNDIDCTPGSVVDAFTIPAATSGSDPGTDPAAVYAEPIVPMPGYLTPIADPTFGTTITRIANNTGASTAPVNGTWGSDSRHKYQKIQPWNADGTLMTIENRASGGGPSPLFLDGNTYRPFSNGCSGNPLYDYRWHPLRAHANELINVSSSGTELHWWDVRNCVKTRAWTLPIASDYGIGSGEGNSSNDGRFVAVASATQMCVIDMDPQPPFAAYPNRRIGPVRDVSECGLADCSIDWVSVSASGRYAVVSYNGDHVRVFDIDPQTLALTPRVYPAGTPECDNHPPSNGWVLGLGHADFALNPFDSNEDVLVGQRRGNCPSTVNGTALGGVVMVRLRDGFVTSLTDPANEAFPHHISTRAYDRPGWAYVSHYPNPGARFHDEIIAVKLDGSRAVERLAHQHSDWNGCYRCETHPVPSRDGRRVLFASNWATYCGTGCGVPTDYKAYVAGPAAPPIASDQTPPAAVRDLRQK